ncbi:MAG: hypothetical protein IPK17_22285 [Chloroflexi bacterium]|uniref:hypothetical protein n=1 Tax=Candidatus Flexifilum breve TaxID=3140694 RepID=UPI003137488A|nr:hypothetical protein [Chloroflexota bacterium]
MTRVLIIGLGAAVHVGAHLLSAAQSLGAEADLLDVTSAYAAPRWLAQINWRLRGPRPTHLDTFSGSGAAARAKYQPQVVIVTGTHSAQRGGSRRAASAGHTLRQLPDR